MLNEIKNIKQIESEPEKRWFNSEQMDLFIWHENHQIIGFQLCYDKEKNEKAISCYKGKGIQHQKVDNGENRPGHYKATPILVQNGSYDQVYITEEFMKFSINLMDELKEVVLNGLAAVR